MPEGAYIKTQEELEARLRAALGELPLSPNDIERVLPRLIRCTDFISQGIREDSSFFDFKSKITAVADCFAPDGLTERAYLKALIKQPQLFYYSPETLQSNILHVVGHFYAKGLTLPDYLHAAVKQPQLFYQSPETIQDNIAAVVDHFSDRGMRLSDYLQAAIKQPSLFCQSPKTIIGHINQLIELYERGYVTLPGGKSAEEVGLKPLFTYLLKSKPVLLTLAEDNLGLREVYGALKNPEGRRLFTMSRAELEGNLAGHLGHPDLRRPVEKLDETDGNRGQFMRNLALRALIRNGFIKGGTIRER